MTIPSQDLICCKVCRETAPPHRAYKALCDVCAKARQVDYQRSYRERLKAIPRLVVCKGCGKQFDASAIGRVGRCPECLTAYQAAYRRKDRERHAGYSRNYRARIGKAEYNRRMNERWAVLIAKMTPDELAVLRRKQSEKSARLRAGLRSDAFAAYGGYRCVCCGETEPIFLSIDHVHNNGAEQRRNGDYSRNGTSFYYWLRKNKFPAGFQVLCLNCNIGKHRNGGICPHQSGKGVTTIPGGEVGPSGPKRSAPV